ncbi:MAG: agmatinase [Herpetosiphon sp.]
MGMSYETAPPDNFLGLDGQAGDRAASKVLVLPVPYELTTSYGQGTRRGPRAIIEASQQVELYDRAFKQECALQWGVHTLPALQPNYESPAAAHAEIAAAVATLSREARLLCVLGGEHSISGSVAAGLKTVHESFVTVQLDAHADLRSTYEGTPYSHASAMRRVLDAQAGPLFEIGIRSLSVDEAEYIDQHPERVSVFYAEQVHRGEHLAPLRAAIENKTVFLTIDVDCFDAALMPATGTPEPDGLQWQQVLAVVQTIVDHAAAIPAFDVVELAPIPALHAPNYLVAKLVYRVMSMIMHSYGR